MKRRWRYREKEKEMVSWGKGLVVYVYGGLSERERDWETVKKGVEMVLCD